VGVLLFYSRLIVGFRWLYKNATVVAEVADTKDTQFVLAEVIITHAKLEKFKHDFAP
jgi:hypothetical protein